MSNFFYVSKYPVEKYHVFSFAESLFSISSKILQVRNLEDQIESAQRELKNAKTDEMSLKRLVTAKHEKLSTTGIRIKKKHEDVEQYKRTVFEYG